MQALITCSSLKVDRLLTKEVFKRWDNVAAMLCQIVGINRERVQIPVGNGTFDEKALEAYKLRQFTDHGFILNISELASENFQLRKRLVNIRNASKTPEETDQA